MTSGVMTGAAEPERHTAFEDAQAIVTGALFIALGILNRVKTPGWRVTLACPASTVTSMKAR